MYKRIKSLKLIDGNENVMLIEEFDTGKGWTHYFFEHRDNDTGKLSQSANYNSEVDAIWNWNHNKVIFNVDA